MALPQDGGEAEDEGSDLEVDAPSRAPTSIERSQVQNIRFKQWMTQQARSEINKSAKSKGVTNEYVSIRELMAKQNSAHIIADPREYQLELFERAKEQNTVAVLDTGTGKTLIAVLLLRHIIDKELEDRHGGRPPRIAFFLVSQERVRW